jgi:hypothetical protein
MILTGWALVARGISGLSVVLFTGWFVVAAVAVWRQRIDVTAQEIVIGNGIWTTRVQRDEIERLQWRTLGQAGRGFLASRNLRAGGLYVVRATGRPVKVTQTDLVDVRRPRGRSSEMANWLGSAISMPVESADPD